MLLILWLLVVGNLVLIYFYSCYCLIVQCRAKIVFLGARGTRPNFFNLFESSVHCWLFCVQVYLKKSYEKNVYKACWIWSLHFCCETIISANTKIDCYYFYATVKCKYGKYVVFTELVLVNLVLNAVGWTESWKHDNFAALKIT